MLNLQEKAFYKDKSVLKNPLKVTKTIEIDGKKYMLDDVVYFVQNFATLESKVIYNKKRESVLKSTFVQLFCVEMFAMVLIILSLAS